MRKFFVRKSFWQLFLLTCNYVEKSCQKDVRTKNSCVKCWWNWHLNSRMVVTKKCTSRCWNFYPQFGNVPILLQKMKWLLMWVLKGEKSETYILRMAILLAFSVVFGFDSFFNHPWRPIFRADLSYVELSSINLYLQVSLVILHSQELFSW